MRTEKNLHWKTFLLALAISTAVFLPFIIYNQGFFIFIGDFNAQQIPFYKLVHQAVREGNFGWSWTTDLGANFIASYSFYNLTSPFFWLTIPFPTHLVPYLLGPLLILKNAFAAFTAYFYLARFVRNKQYAMLGGLLYAFSGFMFYNTFFNHFHEVVVFFPLLLIGMEELVVNNRRGFFAVAVAVNAAVNYWFFIGSAVFCIIYYFFRSTDPTWGMTLKKFFWIAAEAVLGLGLGMFIFMPAVMGILGNPRTTSGNLLTGWNFWVYWHEERYPAILASFFYPPHVPSRPNMFPNHGAKWSSLSGWLPLFGMSGVIAYLLSAKKSWLKKIIIGLFIIAMIPGFNSVFILFNNSYYTRWFYTFVLMMSLATVLSLERRSIDFRRGINWSVGVLIFFTVMIGLTPKVTEGEPTEYGLASDMGTFWFYTVLTALFLAATAFIVLRYKKSKHFVRIITVALSVSCVLFGWVYFIDAKNYRAQDNRIIEYGIRGYDMMEFPNDPDQFERVDFLGGIENQGMYWDVPNLQAFHSIVPVSLMEFYPQVGVKRDVSSKPEMHLFELRSLLSVRWLVAEKTNSGEIMEGFTYLHDGGDFDLYENQHYIPMGFAYEYFIDSYDFESTPKSGRAAILLKGMYLDDAAIARHSDILEPIPEWELTANSLNDYWRDCEERKAQSSHRFVTDNEGFTSSILLDKENLVFFSVPYDDGWSATVNGQPAEIERVNVGFMAVRAPAGENEIRFYYHTPGLKTGLIISGISILILAGYLLLNSKVKKSVQAKQLEYTVLQSSAEKQLSFDDFLETDTFSGSGSLEQQDEKNPTEEEKE